MILGCKHLNLLIHRLNPKRTWNFSLFFHCSASAALSFRSVSVSGGLSIFQVERQACIDLAFILQIRPSAFLLFPAQSWPSFCPDMFLRLPSCAFISVLRVIPGVSLVLYIWLEAVSLSFIIIILRMCGQSTLSISVLQSSAVYRISLLRLLVWFLMVS